MDVSPNSVANQFCFKWCLYIFDFSICVLCFYNGWILKIHLLHSPSSQTPYICLHFGVYFFPCPIPHTPYVTYPILHKFLQTSQWKNLNNNNCFYYNNNSMHVLNASHMTDSFLSAFRVLTQVCIKRIIKMQNVTEHSKVISLEKRKVAVPWGKNAKSLVQRERNKASEWL